MDNNKKKIKKLKNGIKLLVVPINTKLTSISIDIFMGDKHEKRNETELTHYLEHIVAAFTSEKYKDSKKIKKELSDRGAITNASVSSYETKFYIEGLYKDIEFYIDLLSNTLNNFYIDDRIVNVEKNAVIQELNNIIANNDYIFNLKIWKYMYYRYYYLNDNKSHIDFIKKYNTNNLYDYFKKHILLKNILISVTCPLNKTDNTIKLLSKAFNFKKNNYKYKLKYPTFHYKTKDIKILFINNKQPTNNNSILRIMVDKYIKNYSPKHISLIILNNVLFNFQTGIFYEILRRKLGLIYNISFNIIIDLYNYKSSSYYIESNIINFKLPLLIMNILKIIEGLEITNEQIDNAKNTILVNWEYENFFKLNTYTKYYGQYVLYNNPIIEKNTVKNMFKSISYEQIKEEFINFKNDLLHNSLFFYYSNKNFNNNIKETIKSKNLSYKIKYIALN